MANRKLLLVTACIVFISTFCYAQEITLYKYFTFAVNKDIVKLKPGRYDTIPAPVGDNKIAAIKVPPGMKAILYENKNCMGPSFEVYSDIENLRIFGLYGKVSSLKVEASNKNITQQFITLDNINEALCPTTLTRGDREFDGHGPRMKCDVKLRVADNGKSLYADIFFTAQETQNDWSTVEGKWSKKVFEVFESNKRIVKIDYNERAVAEYVGYAAGAEGEIGSSKPISGNYEFWKEMEKKYGINSTAYWKQTRVNYVGFAGGNGNNSCYIIPAMQGKLVSKFHLVGDTGGPDISDDNNCNDDTRVQKIEFNRVYVQIDQQ